MERFVITTYEAFRDRLSQEISGPKKEATPWMIEVGYRPEDRDMGLRRWCELSGTDIEQWIASQAEKESVEAVKNQNPQTELIFT